MTDGIKGCTQVQEDEDGDPESAAIRWSLVFLMSAVSVLWSGRNPDWNCS